MDQPDLPVDPEALRRAARERRRGLVGPARTAAEAAMHRALLGWCEGRAHPGGRLAAYLPTDGEVDLRPAAGALRSGGWQLYLPVLGPDRSMGVAPWDEGTELRANRFGIAEPVGGTRAEVTALDVVLVPCVALDRAGNRLGFGAGYYDRALAAAADRSGPVLVGVAFEAQVVERLLPRPWDVAMGWVLTELGVLPAEQPGS